MLAALGSEPIREPEELLLVDRLQDRSNGALDDLVFQRRDPERSVLPVRLRDIRPAAGQCSVHTSMEPVVQVHEPFLDVDLVIAPCEELKVLYRQIPEKLHTIRDLVNSSWTSFLFSSKPNPMYPKEDFEAFVLRMLDLKKKKIEDLVSGSNTIFKPPQT